VTLKIASFDLRQLRRAGRSQDGVAASGSPMGGLIEYVFDAGGMDYLYEAAMDDPEVGGQASGGLHLERWQGQGLGHQPLVGGRCISRGRLILVLADRVDLRVPVASSASF
jgi:hypothetical protein